MVLPSIWISFWGGSVSQAQGSDAAGLAGGSAALRGCGCPWRMRFLGIRFRVTNTDGGIQDHQGVTFSTVPSCSHLAQRAGDRRCLWQEALRACSRRKPSLPWTRIWFWVTPVQGGELWFLPRARVHGGFGVSENLTCSHGQKGLGMKSWKHWDT